MAEMKLTITPTDRETTYNGSPARVWRGTNDLGDDVAVLVTLIATNSFFPHPGEVELSKIGGAAKPAPDQSVIDAMWPEFAAPSGEA